MDNTLYLNENEDIQGYADESTLCEASDILNILIIDVGVQHLGLVLAKVSKNDYNFDIIDINLINIKEYTHNVCPIEKCELFHTKTFSDWMTHVFREHTAFEEADTILVERQPPLGFVVIEQLIFNRYRNKTHLIHPRNVHSFMNITHLDYENRKVKSILFAKNYISFDLFKQLYSFERAHDISDGICMIAYWCNKQKKDRENIPKKMPKDIDDKHSDFFEKFYYNPKK